MSNQREVVVLAAKRSPVGRLLGALSKYTAVDLGRCVANALLKDVHTSEIDQVIVGNVLMAGQGMNPARQIGLAAGIPRTSPAFTVNMMCASGMQSILLAAQAIRSGEAQCVLCGGVESMSQAPYLLTRCRRGYSFGHGELTDSVLLDGLTDPGSQWHMGRTAELLAEKFGISREQQDEYAALSQQRYAQAHRDHWWANEIVEVDDVTDDEHPRADTTKERLARLKTPFAESGTVTAGNSSGVNDGAALLVLADLQFAIERGYTPLAKFVAGTTVGCDPLEMGLGPVHAIGKLLHKQQRCLKDYDAIEINEAFAAQTLACLRELQLSPEQVNSYGGAIAIGHPIGMSGARLMVHLVQRIAHRQARRGLAALCVGGGMGIAAELTDVEIL